MSTGLLPPPPSETDLDDLPPPPPQARPGHLRVEPDPAPGRLLALALAAGLAVDVGLRGGIDNAVMVLAAGLALAALLTDRRVARREAQIMAMIAVLPAGFLAVRTSPWLLTLDLLAVMALVGAAVVTSRSGSMFDTTPMRLLERGLPGVVRATRGLKALQALVPTVGSGTRTKAARVVVAALLSLPALAALVALLAAADPVFAAMLVPDVDAGPLLGHLVLIVLGAVGVVALAAAAQGDAIEPDHPGVVGPIEVITVLGLAAAVLSLFVLSQMVALTGAGRRLIDSAGLTPAEYARTGFFQLCWAVALVVALLAAVRRLARPEVHRQRAVRVVAAVVPVLALGLVVVSLRRMALYDQAFGLTMLRLWVMGAAVWMGAVLVMLALRNAGVGRRSWVTGGAGIAALVLVVAANVANPEAFVTRHNLNRAHAGHPVDLYYLAGLSDDAVPVIAAALDDPPPGVDQHGLRAGLGCDRNRIGVSTLNLAGSRAQALRDRHC